MECGLSVKGEGRDEAAAGEQQKMNSEESPTVVACSPK